MRARIAQQAEKEHKGKKGEKKRAEPMFPPISLPRQQSTTFSPSQPQPSQDLPPVPNGELTSHPTTNGHSSVSSTSLFLVLQARTLPTAQFRHLRGNYAVLHTPSPNPTPPSHSQPPPSQRLTEEEATSLRPLAASFLSSLISEILADPDVQEEARQHDDDDFIPYFEQLRDENEEERSENGKETEKIKEKEKEKEKENEKEKAKLKHKIERSNSFKISNSFRNLYGTKVLSFSSLSFPLPSHSHHPFHSFIP
jgi:hypothetical protein